MLKATIKKQLGSATGHILTLDVDIKVVEGVTVLFGASGAGKTTILRAIAGIVVPDEGKIILGDKIFSILQQGSPCRFSSGG